MTFLNINLTPPTWTDQAICASMDPELFFPLKGQSSRVNRPQGPPVASVGFETIEAAPKEAATSSRSLTKSTPELAKTREVSMATPQDRPALRPDDRRHGFYAGYTAGCHDECCLTANRRYTKQLIHDHNHGRRRTVPATGFKRRIRALQALGWSVEDLAQMIGAQGSNLRRDLVQNKRVKVARHDEIAALYDRLCMTTAEGPDAPRLRRLAAKRGYLPPLAWDDIDNDETPISEKADQTIHHIDEVKVQRVLNQRLEDCNMAERYAVIERWDGSLNELEKLTGWNVHRMLKREAA